MTTYIYEYNSDFYSYEFGFMATSRSVTVLLFSWNFIVIYISGIHKSYCFSLQANNVYMAARLELNDINTDKILNCESVLSATEIDSIIFKRIRLFLRQCLKL